MTRFVVFHVGVRSLEYYLPFMRIGKKALGHTNPGARYVVLTNKETAPRLENEFEIEVVAPSGKPLMYSFMRAQLEYERKAQPGLVVLAGTDCVANRSLKTALKHNMAVTYRPRGQHLINNIAYIEDHDRAAWFLKNALEALGTFSEDYAHWWGDQASWEAVLGPQDAWETLEGAGREAIKVAKPAGRWIHLYPCVTHNYFSKVWNVDRPIPEHVYLVHYKGTRCKRFMIESVFRHILGRYENCADRL